MSKVAFLIWIALAGLVAETSGQNEYRTNGNSGAPCGKAGHHCMSTAKCEHRKAICQCTAPRVGNGKIGCFRRGDVVAILQLDPILKTFDGDYLKLSTPCRYKVLHYTMATFNSTRASAEVYAKNIVSRKGEYFVSNVLVIISVMTETKVGKYSLLLEGTASGGEYTFVTTVLEDSMTYSSLKIQIDFTKFAISVSVDKVNNFIIARVDGVGLTIRLRPPPAETEDVEKMTPGVTMVIDRDVVTSVKFMNGSLNSSPPGPNITHQANSLGFDVQLYVYFLIIFNTPAIIMDDRICQDSTVSFRSLCTSDKTRRTLLKICAPLYHDTEFLSCLYNKNKLYGDNMEHKLFFRYCVQSFCLNRVDICQQMMHQIEATKCQLPSTMKDFKCSRSSLLS